GGSAGRGGSAATPTINSPGGAADRLLRASGWANVALLLTLSWVLPWYVLWVLPFAALSASRRLRVTALVLGVYLIVAWAPASSRRGTGVGLHQKKPSLGRLHHGHVKELLYNPPLPRGGGREKGRGRAVSPRAPGGGRGARLRSPGGLLPPNRLSREAAV